MMPGNGDRDAPAVAARHEHAGETYWWDDPDELHDLDVIRLMAEEDVDCPLWCRGLLFSDASEFIAFGGPEDLARDLAEWAADRDAYGRTPRSDGVARELVERLTTAFEHRFRFVYKP
ncbi:hypothetical protein ACJ5H2_05380 [Nocardioides sp. R1-1]|uniref:hypothetical protein n=1 Tax=Nocardioides sp. R1-1 TaxID=3383502 RepID=UPI0038D1F1C4